MKVRYRLSDSALRAAFVATGTAPDRVQTLEIAAAELTADDRRRWVERHGLATDAALAAALPGRYGGDNRIDFVADRIHADGPALVREYLDWADGAIEADRAKRQAEWDAYAADLAAMDARPDADLVRRDGDAVKSSPFPDRPSVAAAGLEGVDKSDDRRDRLAARIKTLVARHRAEIEAAKEAAKEKAEADRLAWIEAHGSDHLKKACRAGYNCQRKYVTERAALEFPGFVVDFDDNANWNERACPSEEALDILATLPADAAGKIVWLTASVEPTDDEDADSEEDCWAAREAIVIREFLGKYDLIRDV